MRRFRKLWLPALLVLFLLAAAACTDGTPELPGTDRETLPSTEAPTDPAAVPDTETPTEESTQAPETAEATDAHETNAPDEPEETLPADKDIEVAVPDKLEFSTAVTVRPNGGSASVTHGDGLSYTASGYSSASDSTLTFTKDLTLVFDPASTAEPFNRFTLGYTSTQPLYGQITYTAGVKKTTDDFYLEAGTHTFSCVIGQYLNGGKGTFEDQTVIYDGKASEPSQEPTLDNYKFGGWQLDGQAFNWNTKIREDITLTASWVQKRSSVRHHSRPNSGMRGWKARV